MCHEAYAFYDKFILVFAYTILISFHYFDALNITNYCDDCSRRKQRKGKHLYKKKLNEKSKASYAHTCTQMLLFGGDPLPTAHSQ